MRQLVMLTALLTLLGCGKKDDPAFHTLIDKAMNDLRTKTASHQAQWGLGSSQRWDLSQDDGHLIFTFADRRVICEAQIIGSYDKSKGTWLWAWDNPSAAPNLTKTSRQIREYGEQHGYKKLTQAEWRASEDEAWEMVALATELSGAAGAYRGPAGDVFVFITFGTPQFAKHEPNKITGANHGQR